MSDIRESMFDKVPQAPANRKQFPYFSSWESAEANYWGIEQANCFNYGLMQWEQGKWEAIYRLVFPEEAPWGPVAMPNGTTCSPYRWEKLIERLEQLLAGAGKSPAEGWRSTDLHEKQEKR